MLLCLRPVPMHAYNLKKKLYLLKKCIVFFFYLIQFKRDFPYTDCTIIYVSHESSANIPMNQLQCNDFVDQMRYALFNSIEESALNDHD